MSVAGATKNVSASSRPAGVLAPFDRAAFASSVSALLGPGPQEDPAAVVMWVGYAVYVHSRSTAGWRTIPPP